MIYCVLVFHAKALNCCKIADTEYYAEHDCYEGEDSEDDDAVPIVIAITPYTFLLLVHLYETILIRLVNYL